MITTTVLGPGKAKVILDGVTTATVSSYADLAVDGTAAIDRLTVTGMQRGTISTYAGDDNINLTTAGLAATDLITLDTGAGNDSVVLRLVGSGQTIVTLGDGNDVMSMWGPGSATVDAGAGNDSLSISLKYGGTYDLGGGAGNDSLDMGGAVSDFSFEVASDGSPLLRLAKDRSASVKFSGFESISFTDGVLSAAMLANGMLAPRLVSGVVQLYGLKPATVQGITTATIQGSAFADQVTVTDYLRGAINLGTGNDVLDITTGIGAAADAITLDAGDGDDTVIFRGNGAGKASILLGAGNDSLTLSGVSNATVDAGDGNDTVTASFDGTYVLQGGAGTDTLSVNAALSAVTFGRAANGSALLGLIGKAGVSIQVDGFENVRFSDSSALTLDQFLARLPSLSARESGVAQNTINSVTSGTNTQTGTVNNDYFSGIKGAYILKGGLGDDSYEVYALEKVVEDPNAGVDTVYYMLDGTYALPANVENLTLRAAQNRPLSTQANLAYLNYTAGATGIGNELNNIIKGSAADNTLDGKAGDDILTGGGGKDIFVYGTGYGNDRITDFIPGTDKIRFVSGPLTGAAVKAAMTDTANGVVLNLGAGNTLTLTGVKKDALSDNDFQFAVDLSKYKLTFADEFSNFVRLNGRDTLTGSLGDGNWLTRTTSGDGTLISGDENVVFVDQGTKALGLNPFSVSDGVLSINATWRPDLAGQFNGRQVVSGFISTLGGFAQQYGYVEARLKLSDQTGGFPAFWLLPVDGSWPPEIDIMEQRGSSPNQVYQMTGDQPVDTTQWHTYGLEWTATRLAWTIDGIVTQVVETTAFNKPMYIILDYALGGTWAGAVPDLGLSKAGASLGSMQIDYVRAYEATTGAAPRATIPDGAPDVTFSIGALTLGGTPVLANSWHYIADTTSKMTLKNADLNFATLYAWLTVAIDNDRATNTYSAIADNGNAGLNVQVKDGDGGTFSFSNLAMAEVRLGGTANSSVTLDTSQFGYVDLGAGNDTVKITGETVWDKSRSTTFQVYAGAGNDTVIGWSEKTGRLEAYGGVGNDSIVGSGADDLLVGGAGDDTMTGGGGANIYRFVKGEGGIDTITDFYFFDSIQLQGFTQADKAAMKITKGSGGVGAVITLPGETILLSAFKTDYLGPGYFSWLFA